MKYFFRPAILALPILLGGCSVFGHQGAPIAPYKIIQQNEAFEIRQYPPLIMAQTIVDGDYKTMSSIGFKRLFKYISGANIAKKEITMTAPVLQEQTGESIAMTAPVMMQAQEKSWAMAFVLPAATSFNNAPQPSDPAVKLIQTTAQKMATIIFSGVLSPELIQASTHDLQQWITKNNHKIIGTPVVAGYDPPWTIPVLRRNEIQIPIE